MRDAKLDLCRKNGLTSPVADSSALVGGLRFPRVPCYLQGSRSPFGRQKFVLLGCGPRDWSREMDVFVEASVLLGDLNFNVLVLRSVPGEVSPPMAISSELVARLEPPWRYLAYEQGRFVRVCARRLLRPIRSGIRHCGLNSPEGGLDWVLRH